MIKIIAITKEAELITDAPIERLQDNDVDWFWVDIWEPQENDVKLLSEHFGFHHLAIEDCLHYYERPKVDFYEDYNFFILYSLNHKTLKTINLDLFVGKNYIVSFHKSEIPEVLNVRQKIIENKSIRSEGRLYLTYLFFDEITDQYFPAVYDIEDKLGRIVIRAGGNVGHRLINRVFELREDLLKLRRTINAMKELMYRILNSEHLHDFRSGKQYFNDIYDHLLKLSDIVESNREMTADMRDSYLSINSHHMNQIMTILTIISSIFIPLTFIVGIYGMNFDYIPELKWKFGYFLILGFMGIVGIGMFLWFKIKGWLNIYK